MLYNWNKIEEMIESGKQVMVTGKEADQVVNYFDYLYDFMVKPSISNLHIAVKNEKERIRKIDKNSRLQYTISLSRKIEQKREWEGGLEGYMNN